MRVRSTRQKLIGEIGVDAGMVMVGDPCYTIPENNQLGNPTWEQFLERLPDDQYPAWILENKRGATVAIVVASGEGDGVYPVYAELNNEGRVARVIIEFIE